ncbi:MAG: sigma-70 family RNA polymerase sigma factor [Candidatus Gastranaerophilales bacterium]|nr:sigma-70 family RNA polymerase sigma factor [Candidatus Gastranaerophilales bacterium]
MCKAATKQADKALREYKNLIETLARVEYKRLSSYHVIDISELINIGTIAVHILLKNGSQKSINKSYIGTAIKWAIRNELRRRYKWYSLRYSSPDETASEFEEEELREAVYETILSIDYEIDGDTPIQVKDDKTAPDRNMELSELNLAIRNSIKKLPPREKQIVESRFFKGMKLKDLALDLNISPSRTSRVIQAALNKIKKDLEKQELIN